MPSMSAQDTEHMLGKKVPATITVPAGSIQNLSMGSETFDVTMGETDAGMTHLDGEQMQVEMKTSPKQQKMMWYDAPGTQAHKWTRSMTRCGTHKNGKVSRATPCPHRHSSSA
jgi:hypothetical protein